MFCIFCVPPWENGVSLYMYVCCYCIFLQEKSHHSISQTTATSENHNQKVDHQKNANAMELDEVPEIEFKFPESRSKINQKIIAEEQEKHNFHVAMSVGLITKKRRCNEAQRSPGERI